MFREFTRERPCMEAHLEVVKRFRGGLVFKAHRLVYHSRGIKTLRMSVLRAMRQPVVMHREAPQITHRNMITWLSV